VRSAISMTSTMKAASTAATPEVHNGSTAGGASVHGIAANHQVIEVTHSELSVTDDKTPSVDFTRISALRAT
jgi:hypothetical protein